jgi:hypothetical protein
MPHTGITFEQLAAIFDPDPSARPSAGAWIRALRMQSSTAAVRTTSLPPVFPGTVSEGANDPADAQRRRSTRTAAAVGGTLAVIAGLAVAAALSDNSAGDRQLAANDRATTTSRTAGATQSASASASASATPAASPSLSPSLSVGPAVASQSLLLVDMQPETTELLQGTWTVGSVKYPQSIACRDCESGRSAVYRPAGRYRRFKATLDTDARDAAARGWAGEDARASAAALKALADAAVHNRPLPDDAAAMARRHAERIGQWAASLA